MKTILRNDKVKYSSLFDFVRRIFAGFCRNYGRRQRCEWASAADELTH